MDNTFIVEKPQIDIMNFDYPYCIHFNYVIGNDKKETMKKFNLLVTINKIKYI
jgi:hypothetical protein